MAFKFFDKKTKENGFEDKEYKPVPAARKTESEKKMTGKPTSADFSRRPSFAKSPSSVRNSAPPIREASTTVFGKDISFKGELRGNGNVKIDGRFEGEIILERDLTIMRNGNVEADIEADVVNVEGRLVGNVNARKKMILSAQGSMIGDIRSEKIIISEGAVFKGKVEMQDAASAEKKPEAPEVSDEDNKAANGEKNNVARQKKNSAKVQTKFSEMNKKTGTEQGKSPDHSGNSAETPDKKQSANNKNKKANGNDSNPELFQNSQK